MKEFVIILLLFFFLSMDIVCGESSVVKVETKDVMVDETFIINVTCFPSEPIKGWEFKIKFDPSVIQVVSVSEGDFFKGYPTFYVMGNVDNDAGTIINIYDLIVGKGPKNMSGSRDSFRRFGIGDVDVAGGIDNIFSLNRKRGIELFAALDKVFEDFVFVCFFGW